MQPTSIMAKYEALKRDADNIEDEDDRLAYTTKMLQAFTADELREIALNVAGK